MSSHVGIVAGSPSGEAVRCRLISDESNVNRGDQPFTSTYIDYLLSVDVCQPHCAKTAALSRNATGVGHSIRFAEEGLCSCGQQHSRPAIAEGEFDNL
jgi:hypothetical protein